ncbi:MAG: TonB-dependent receptor [Bacteroidota bacterium]|nr:TonB-dependent receptor [Bacteroidota bacterium]
MKKRILLSSLFMLFCFLQTMAQQRTITGTVITNDGTPLTGASVVVVGQKTGETTGPDGTFSIKVSASAKTLRVSYVGYESQDISIAGQSNINVALKSSATNLNEIVVTGYTSERKKDITGAVSVVNVDQMQKMPAGTGEAALQGRASGVNIITSGQPGGNSDIRIRGITGFGSNQPLVIIDGVRGDLTDINVNDIASIQVLKDASAAIYGVAGSNGVIIITTKKGKTGKAKITYNGYYGTTTRGKGWDMATPQEEANAIWLQQQNSGIANPSSKQYGSGATPVVPDYITPTGYTVCNCPGDSVINPALYDLNTYQITKANKAGTNWYDEITRNAPTQSHNISVAAGSDKSSYYVDFGYLNQQGIAKYTYLERYSLRANTQFNVNDHIRIGENAYLFYKKNPQVNNQQEGSPFSMGFREDPIIPVYDIMGNFAGTKSQDLGNAQNVFANLYRSKDNVGNNWQTQGNVFADVDFLKNFTAHTSFGGSISNNHYYYFNYVAYENAEGNTGSNSFHEGSSYDDNWTWTNTLQYNKLFGEHSVNVLVGAEAVSYYGRGIQADRGPYFSENPNFWIIDAGPTAGAANSGYAYQSSLWSQFAQLKYAYKDRYLVSATLRRDQSSVFLDSVRTGYFPAVSAAWRISQENFFKPITFVNDLKIRYSWGKMGNTQNVGATNPYNLYNSNAGRSYYDLQGNSTTPLIGYYKSNIGNPTTSWEGDIISNVGIDASILNNKIDFTVDWYKKKISGLLFTASGVQYDQIFTGDANLPQVNIGDMQNTGIDANVTYHGTVGKEFKFDVTGTFTSYNNKLVSIPGLPYFNGPTIRNVVVQRNEVGHSVGEFYGYQVIGLFQSADDVSKSPTQSDAAPGFFKYKDVNGDGKIDANDRTFIGNPNPDFTYGLNISFSYKNFDFSTFFFGSHGNDIFNNTLFFTDFPDFFKGAIRKEVALNSWTPTNTNTSIPKLSTTGGFSTDGVTNSYFISKGSYMKNKQMQIGYTLPESLLSKYGIDRLRVYVQATNMFTITKYKGLDPELQSDSGNNGGSAGGYYLGYGIDQGNYPHTPAYLFGVNLNF